MRFFGSLGFDCYISFLRRFFGFAICLTILFIPVEISKSYIYIEDNSRYKSSKELVKYSL